ncbi:MAG: hypothetical protein IJZ33_04990 [Clostridia bacterium]|nr:hypothetical protein [Clostridia bacterium]
MAKKIVSAAGRFSNSTSSGSDDSFKAKNIGDYTVAKKVEGKYRMARILYIVGFFAVIILVIALFGVIIPGGYGVMAGLAMSGLGGWMLWFFTRRYVEIEYSYAIENGELICTEIYGNKSDKLLLRTKISNIERTAPYEEPYKAEADAFDMKDRIYLISSPSSDQIYFSIYKKEDGSKGVVFYEGSTKTIGAFKYYNSQNTVVKELRR